MVRRFPFGVTCSPQRATRAVNAPHRRATVAGHFAGSKGHCLLPHAACRAALLSFALLAIGGCSSSPPATDPSSPAAQADDGVRRNPVVAGRRARVFVMAGFGEKCESLPAPDITVTRPPAKGSVSFEPGQETTVNTSATGTCIGQHVLGTGIYYTARAGETGSDTFTVEASLGGSVTQRTFAVEIVE